ncbi:ABC-type antimicrobial peptide transport system, permease component [Catalinimonas alkaloidigena]|uniref:ABC-type antimicrobial peptide transport system, permease component n=1 Tax=Catalinimonas alkaloidigena TaxID=1075417 RepID=A0A1G9TYH6_9BACT|nr:ABC transporter permease [Catalinimonas alkaloidigena]SDM52839.1 ABC-type antimicrobial peptide transport system, permease component [Catalinimonas alkaloidigena]
MFKNYFKTAARNLRKNRFFTTLNVVALALAMSISLLYVAMMVFLFQFENFHSNAEHLYRVITHVRDQDENPSFASVPIGTAELLKGNVTGVEQVVRIHQSLPREVHYGDRAIPVRGYFVDPAYLSMFTFPLLRGNPATALAKPRTMVVSQAAAARIFGETDPMGELVFIEPFGEVMVTGVAKDLPKNSHLKTEVLVSFATLTSHHGASFTDDEKNWNHFYNSYAYVQLADQANPSAVEAFLNRVAKEKYPTPAFQASFELQRLDQIVPGPELDNDMGNEWSYQEMALLGILPMIILLAACSNYVSLAISQSLQRMKEIGVRKVMGAQKKQIFLQFVLESTLMMLLAVSLSYGFFELIRNEALALTDSYEWVDLNPTLGTFAGFVVFALLVGLAAGMVPALHFSKMGSTLALKGKAPHTKTGGWFSLRHLVITSQFILSLGFIMAVVVMVQQHRHAIAYDFGFDQEKILNVDLQQADPQLVKDEFGKLSFVPLISMSSHPLGVGNVPGVYVKRVAQADSIAARRMAIDEHFITNLGLQLVLGRNFTHDAGENAHLIIINEAFAKHLSPKNASGALGEVILLADQREVHVVGIVKDFHYASLQSPIENFFFEYAPEKFHYANFHFHATNERQAFLEMEAAWQVVGNGDTLKAEFLVDQLREAYSFYNRIVEIWGFMGLLAITIACLGLLGTVVFTVKNRVKEVSIRKVMGASSPSLVFLLSKDFILLLSIAAILTLPSVYFFMTWMLQEEQYYSAPIGVFEVVISLAVVLTLGLATIFSQTWKAANTNPVDHLKVE